MGLAWVLLPSCGGSYHAYHADGVYHRPAPKPETVAATERAKTAGETTEQDYDYYDPNAPIDDFRPWEVPNRFDAPPFSTQSAWNIGFGMGSPYGFGCLGPSWNWNMGMGYGGMYDPWYNPWNDPFYNPWNGPGWGNSWGYPGMGYPNWGYPGWGGGYGGPSYGSGDALRPIGQPVDLPRPNRSGNPQTGGTPTNNGRIQRVPTEAPNTAQPEKSGWRRDLEDFFTPTESPSRPSRTWEPSEAPPARTPRGGSEAPSRPAPSGGGGRSGGSTSSPSPRTR